MRVMHRDGAGIAVGDGRVQACGPENGEEGSKREALRCARSNPGFSLARVTHWHEQSYGDEETKRMARDAAAMVNAVLRSGVNVRLLSPEDFKEK